MAAPTVSELKNRYPAFTSTPDSLVSQKISEAVGDTSTTAFGAKYKDYVMLYAAHLLVMEPEGERMRLKDGTSPHEERLKRMRVSAAIGRGRVA
jgi:Protein of unknown function (DUF4054)